MAKTILEVRGIGPATVTLLAENGIMTAEDLAGKTVRQVAAIKGFSEIRATQVINDAKALISSDTTKESKKTKPEKKAVKKKKVTKKSGQEKSKKKVKEKKTKKTVKADKKNKKAVKNKKSKKSAKKNKK